MKKILCKFLAVLVISLLCFNPVVSAQELNVPGQLGVDLEGNVFDLKDYLAERKDPHRNRDGGLLHCSGVGPLFSPIHAFS